MNTERLRTTDLVLEAKLEVDGQVVVITGSFSNSLCNLSESFCLFVHLMGEDAVLTSCSFQGLSREKW